LGRQENILRIDLKNCNNIVSGQVDLEEGLLNIRYAVNGTGKSTIGKAIALASENADLSSLQTFGHSENPEVSLSPALKRVLLFNEDFVNNIVFQESEVIKSAFEVLIKTPEYERRQHQLQERLKRLHIDVEQNQDLSTLITTGQAVLGKFSLTQSEQLKQVGAIKSLTTTKSIFKLPTELVKFKPLMEKGYITDWVGWKTEGAKFDDNHICPFCTVPLSDQYEGEKAMFTEAYSKSNVKNVKEVLTLFEALSDFMVEEKRTELHRVVEETEDPETINFWVKKFYQELQFLLGKIAAVLQFNSYQVRREDVANLGTQLGKLTIDTSPLDIFKSERTESIVSLLNGGIAEILLEVEALKQEMGALKGVLSSTTEQVVADINEFLYLAGISYVFEIRVEAEESAKSILKYRARDDRLIAVPKIKLHLSWGERNAFALVLFMHYSLSQSADLIVLDDPISSFDSNKKYAIISRLFLNASKRSFYRKSVLLLTHDFQPILDFLVNGKPNREYVRAKFLRNAQGAIVETTISKEDIRSLTIVLSENSKNPDLPLIHRLASLRKLFEHFPQGQATVLAYNVLSSLLHGYQKPKLKDAADLSPEQYTKGAKQIRIFIRDFEYDNYLALIQDTGSLGRQFVDEVTPYFKLQIFRVLVDIANVRSKIQDDTLLKYIDEQFHVENDFMYYLDFQKYDTVPEFVVEKCLEFLRKERLVS